MKNANEKPATAARMLTVRLNPAELERFDSYALPVDIKPGRA